MPAPPLPAAAALDPLASCSPQNAGPGLVSCCCQCFIIQPWESYGYAIAIQLWEFNHILDVSESTAMENTAPGQVNCCCLITHPWQPMSELPNGITISCNPGPRRRREEELERGGRRVSWNRKRLALTGCLNSKTKHWTRPWVSNPMASLSPSLSLCDARRVGWGAIRKKFYTTNSQKVCTTNSQKVIFLRSHLTRWHSLGRDNQLDTEWMLVDTSWHWNTLHRCPVGGLAVKILCWVTAWVQG